MSEHISASQLTTWLRCPRQYRFRYIEGLKLPPRAAMTRGIACHKAWETDHRHKMENKENLPLSDVLDVYSTTFDQGAIATEFGSDEDKGSIKDVGAVMTTIYHDKVSKTVQPVAVEFPFEIEFENHIIQGVIDLETDQKEIRDAKTAAKRKSNIPLDHQLQLAIYAIAKPDAKSFILDNAVVTKKNQDVEILTLLREELPHKRLKAFLSAFGESLVRDYFPPTNPDNWCCSATWCGFYQICKFGNGDQ